MSIHFYVGQKVVLVKMGPRSFEVGGYKYPELGVVYKVRGIFPFRGYPCLLLDEIHNRSCTTVIGYIEPGFGARYFRPVVERKTDISIFTAMLNPTKKTVEA